MTLFFGLLTLVITGIDIIELDMLYITLLLIVVEVSFQKAKVVQGGGIHTPSAFGHENDLTKRTNEVRF